VVTVTGKVEDLMPRIVAERRAKKYLADLYSGGIGSGRIYYNLHSAGALDPIKSTLILPEVTDGKHWLGGKPHYPDPEGEYVFMFEGNLTSVGAFYNRDLIKPKEFNSYWDLLDPKWKRKIIVYDPANAGISSFISYYYNPKLGPEFVRKLVGEMELVESRNRRQATDWLASGTSPLCISCRDVDAAKRKGLPVDEFDRDQLKESGTEIGVSGNSGLVLINKAPHPNAARVFINWYLSREGQMVWQRVMNKKVIEATESMRVDISKDDVPPEHRRSPDKEYRVSGFQDRAAVLKMIKEALESRGVKQK
jgi:iron(III) transport system substrate-binding protein